MLTTVDARRKLEMVFNEKQAIVLSDVIASSYNELVKTSDFSELKGIVKDIVEVQKRTEIKMGELAEAQKEGQKEITRLDKTMQELAEAQKRTEIELQKTQIAVQKTEIEVQKTQIEVQKLTRGLKETNQNLGGLSRSMGYSLENEVYRMLPSLLKNSYDIELKERLIRTEIGGKEINILGRARRNGKDVLVVGEVKIRLDDRRKRDIFVELEEKVQAVKSKYKEEPIRMLITHYATKGFMNKANKEGVIVIQSFEW